MCDGFGGGKWPAWRQVHNRDEMSERIGCMVDDICVNFCNNFGLETIVLKKYLWRHCNETFLCS